MCPSCRRRRAERRVARIALGLCTRCPRTSVDGSEFCESCRVAKNAANLESFRRTR